MCASCKGAPTCECEWRVCAARRGQPCSLCGHDSSAPRRPRGQYQSAKQKPKALPPRPVTGRRRTGIGNR